ncbi:hypothetical protein [Aquihabitans sp. McL0605]|uniref:hypothetical protein n=1 Tax=Aquihabitans sp. McL0605 TaxID=3415671 RepID=UPI003CF77E4C
MLDELRYRLSAERRHNRRHFFARLVALDRIADLGCDCPKPFPILTLAEGRRAKPVYLHAHLPSCPVLDGHECQPAIKGETP